MYTPGGGAYDYANERVDPSFATVSQVRAFPNFTNFTNFTMRLMVGDLNWRSVSRRTVQAARVASKYLTRDLPVCPILCGCLEGSL
jgi:hypothetical protein